MQIEKRGEAAFMIYFMILLSLVGISMKTNVNMLNLVYLIVVLCCSLKFILIVNKNKK